MKCSSCGREMSADALFCPYCGAKQEASSRQGASSYRGASPGRRAARKQKKKKRFPLRLLIVLALTAALAVFLARTVLGTVNDPRETIEQFLKAVAEEDAQSVAEVSAASGGKLRLDEESLAPFFRAYSGDENALEGFRTALTEDLRLLEQGRESEGGGVLRLAKKDYLLFSAYKVELTVCSVALSSEYDHTTLTLDGQEHTVGQAPEFLDLLPGTYTAGAVYTDEATGAELTSPTADRRVAPGSTAIHCTFVRSGALLSTACPELELTALAIDGRPYGGELTDLDLETGFLLAPLALESVLDVDFTASGLSFHRTIRLQEGTYCLLEQGLRTVRFAGSCEGIAVTGLTVDGTDYAAALEELDPFAGFSVGPLDPESEIRIRYSVGGLDFEEAVPAQVGHFRLAPKLPEGAQEEGEALAEKIAPLLVQLSASLDEELLNQLEALCGGADPMLAESWRERIRVNRERLNAAADASYARYGDLEAASVHSGTPEAENGRLLLPCTVELRCTGSTTYRWGTDEVLSRDPDAAPGPVTVELAYEDGRWAVADVTW